MIAVVAAASSRRAAAIAFSMLLLSITAGTYVATHVSVRTELEALVAPDLPWRIRESKFEAAFPKEGEDITVVIDGATPELAERASRKLAANLRRRTDLFQSVDQLGDDIFLQREALLFLPRAELEQTISRLLASQPLLAPVAADPSLRGVLAGLNVAIDQSLSGAPVAQLAPMLRVIDDVAARSVLGDHAFLAWRGVLSGSAPSDLDRRRVISILPRVESGDSEPGEAGMEVVRAFATKFQMDATHGVRLRMTGSQPMAADELSTLEESTGPIGLTMMALVVAILLAAVRSARLTLAMVVTAICGLSLTSAFGLLVFGRFTLISVAFLPLCVGLGVDFAIQFCSRLRAEMKDEPPIIEALKHTSRGIGFGLALASGATCLGFLAFLPTSYRGLSELGLIAGAGMIIAFMTTISLLPALITLLGVRGGAAETGLAHFARIEKIVEGRPAQVVAVIAVLCLAAAASAPQLKFNFDPLRLRDPRTESVSTYRDLSDSPETTPATLDVMEPSLAVADREAQRLAAVPGVSRAMTLSSLVPTDQAAKLAAISDAGMLLDPTLNPFETLPPPSDAELVAALDKTGEKLKLLAAQASGDLALRAASLAKLFYAAANAAPADRARLQDALTAGLPTALDDLRNVLTAKPVSLASIPYETKLDWVTPSGAARIEVYPTLAAHGMSGDFVEAVQKVAPNVLGSSIFARELQRTILAAFAKAAIWSLLGISLLLLVALRRVRSIILALLPIAAAGLLTVGTCVLTRQDINLENIISLPLLFGVGVSFNIYFVVAWSRGARRLLSSSLARGVVFSALATGSAFSALTLSSHPGTASMGALLMIALFWILVTTLTLQPAVLILSERRGLSSASPSSRRAF